jgi:hypothetical protein
MSAQRPERSEGPRERSEPASGEEAPPPRPDIVAVGLAVTILVVVTAAGAAVLVPLGVVAGPTADIVLTPRLLRRLGRHYASPGAALWALAFAAVAMLPTIAIAAQPSARTAEEALVTALGLTAPGVILGVYARRGSYARLGLIGAAASLAISALALVLYRTG